MQLPRLNSRKSERNRGPSEDLQAQLRLREVQKQLSEFKSQVERRFAALNEEQPLRISNVLKSIEQKEGGNSKGLALKLNFLEESVNGIKENMRSAADITSANFLELQRRLQVLEYNASSVQFSIQSLAGKQALVPAQFPREVVGSRGQDAKIVRQLLLQEKAQREALGNQLFRKFQQLAQKVQGHQYQVQNRLRRQREELSDEQKQTLRQLKQLQKVKAERMQNDNQLMRKTLSILEQKVEGTLGKRARQESDGRRLVEEKIASIREQILSEEQRLARQRRQVGRDLEKEVGGLQSSIKQTKEDLLDLFKRQQLQVADSLKSIARATDENNARLQSQLIRIRDQQTLLENALADKLQGQVPPVVDQGRDRLASLKEDINRLAENASEETRQAVQKAAKDNEQWRQQFEQKNILVLKEVSVNIKALKGEVQKIKKEKKQEGEGLKATIDSVKAEFEQSLKGTSTSLVNVFNNEFDVLVRQVEILVDLIDVAKKETEKSIAKAVDQCRTELTRESEQKAVQLEKQVLEKAARAATEEGRALRNEILARLQNEQKANSQDQGFLHKDIAELKQQSQSQRKELEDRIERLDKGTLKLEANLRKEIAASAEKGEEFLRRFKLGFGQQFAREKESMQRSMEISLESAKKSMDTQLAKVRIESERVAEQTKSSSQEIQVQVLSQTKRMVNDLVGSERQARTAKMLQLSSYVDSMQKTTAEMVGQKVDLTKMLLQSQFNQKLGEVSRGLQSASKKLQAQQEQFGQQIKKRLEDEVQTTMTLITNETKRVESRVTSLQQSTAKQFKALEQKVWTDHQKILESIFELGSDLQATITTNQLIARAHRDTETEAIHQIQDAIQVLSKGA